MSYSAPSSYTPRGSRRELLAERLQSRAPVLPPPPPAPAEPRRLRLFAPFGLALLLVLGAIFFAVLRPQHSASPSAPGGPGALVWGNGLFSDQDQVKAWLHVHRGNFGRWVVKHPAAVRLVPTPPR
jgi:hypothetical protein